MVTQSVKTRFEAKYQKGSADECWEWRAAIGTHGYGVIGIGDSTTLTAHRLSWQIYRGNIPNGMMVLHTCDNRKCVNPNHLYLGTAKDNARDHMERGDPYCFKLRENMTPEQEAKRLAALPRGDKHNRYNAKKTHCPKGHEYAGDNLFVSSDGRRHCRACGRERTQLYREKQRRKANG